MPASKWISNKVWVAAAAILCALSMFVGVRMLIRHEIYGVANGFALILWSLFWLYFVIYNLRVWRQKKQRP